MSNPNSSGGKPQSANSGAGAAAPSGSASNAPQSANSNVNNNNAPASSSSQGGSAAFQPPSGGLGPSGPTDVNQMSTTCGICFGILKEPATLPCKHCFCMQCVRDKLNKAGAGDGYTCLLCSNHYPELSSKTIGDYFDRSLADRVLQLSRGADARPTCLWCDEKEANVFCPECLYTLCSDCNAAVHKMGRKKQHQPITIHDSRSIRNATKKCPEKGHEEYKLEFYCLQCEMLCCAYCLQIGPHKMHDNVIVSKAAMDVRNQMGRDLENLGHIKTRLEQQANELNRVQGQYLETYDHVESLIEDRFAAFRQQLAQKEVDVRKLLAGLREMGDTALCEARGNFLQKIDAINMAGITYRRLQHGGADYEVLMNRSTVNAFLNLDLHPVTGTGFRLSDLGDVNVSGLEISLDLNARGPEDNGAGGSRGALITSSSGMQYSANARNPQGTNSVARGMGNNNYNNQNQNNSGIITVSAGNPRSLSQQQQHNHSGGFRWTFAPDNDVEFRESADGLSARCLETAESGQIGIRTNESFDNVRSIGGADNNNQSVSWRIRLDRVADTFVGVVDSTVLPGQAPEGFYWRPMKQGQFDGRVGRASHVLKTLPVCRPGDILKFTYEFSSRSLKLAINNIDRGVIVVDVPATVAPCFIYRPGEALTLLW